MIKFNYYEHIINVNNMNILLTYYEHISHNMNILYIII